jgi:hypothetical protein
MTDRQGLRRAPALVVYAGGPSARAALADYIDGALLTCDGRCSRA